MFQPFLYLLFEENSAGLLKSHHYVRLFKNIVPCRVLKAAPGPRAWTRIRPHMAERAWALRDPTPIAASMGSLASGGPG